MEKSEITVSLDRERLEALEYYLRLENTTPKKQLTEALAMLYEQKVPGPVREYIESRSKTSPHPPRHPAKGGATKSAEEGSKTADPAAPREEGLP